MGFTNWLPVVMPYGDVVKRSRQLMHRFMSPSAVEDYHELQTQSNQKMLGRLLRNPDGYFEFNR